MGCHEPGRDQDPPGDPPSKWAPLSRTTRAALPLTVIAGVVIALMVISTRSAGVMDAMGAPAAGQVLMVPSDHFGPLRPAR